MVGGRPGRLTDVHLVALAGVPLGSMNLDHRCRILVEYGKWTALSAVKSGGPIKAQKPVYQLLDGVAFSKVLNRSLGPITCEEFNHWHRDQTVALCARAKPKLPPRWVKAHGSEFPVGWGAKLINVFLKTTAYVGDLGRKNLRDALHPPLDNRLRDRLVKCFHGCPEIRDAVKFHSIKAIEPYEQYQGIINGCRAAAEELAKRGRACSLFEVEQLWST